MLLPGAKVVIHDVTQSGLESLNNATGTIDSVSALYVVVKVESGPHASTFVKLKPRQVKLAEVFVKVQSPKHSIEESSQGSFKEGDRVFIFGLVASADYNGCQGILGDYVSNQGRWYVSLGKDSRGTLKSALLKPVNLRVCTPDDDEALVNKFVRRSVDSRSLTGKVCEFTRELGCYVVYEDGNREHMSLQAVMENSLLLDDREKARFSALIAKYPNTPSEVFQSAGEEDEPATKQSKQADAELIPPRRNLQQIADTFSKPVVFYQHQFVAHKGGGQDSNGLWLRGIVERMQKTSLWSQMSWVDEASRSVSIEEIAESGVHSRTYLDGLFKIDEKVREHGAKIDLAKPVVISMLGRAWACCDSECIMDSSTLEAVMLRCSMTLDALTAMLEGRLPSALILARPACHHVPYVVDKHLNHHCEVCNSDTNPEQLLTCESPTCPRGYHIYCLDAPISLETLNQVDFLKEPWICPVCKDSLEEMTVSPGRHHQHDESDDIPAEYNLNPGDEISCGFCFVNAIAFSIRSVQQKFPNARIAILDVDVHHGNGNQDVFWEDKSVLHISMHRYGETPSGERIMPSSGFFKEIGIREGFGYNVNFEMRNGDGDAEYSDAVRQVVLPVLKQFKPDVLLLLCGFDALDHSHAPQKFVGPGMDCSLSPVWYWWLVTMLKAEGFNRILCSTEGGYDPVAAGKAGECISRGLLGEQVPLNFLAGIEQRPHSQAWRDHLKERADFFNSVGWTNIS